MNLFTITVFHEDRSPCEVYYIQAYSERGACQYLYKAREQGDKNIDRLYTTEAALTTVNKVWKQQQ